MPRVRASIHGQRVLRMATLDAATFMGEADERGVIRKGAVVDWVVLDENPLLDIENARKVSGVMARGRYLDRDAIDARLRANSPSR